MAHYSRGLLVLLRVDCDLCHHKRFLGGISQFVDTQVICGPFLHQIMFLFPIDVSDIPSILESKTVSFPGQVGVYILYLNIYVDITTLSGTVFQINGE